MANVDQAPSRTMPNLLHVLPAFADEAGLRVNTIIELNSNTINKYELITETGHLKLDRVGYSSLAYPFAYGCIPRTWDEDGDPLDIEIVGVTEPLVPGSIVEARIEEILRNAKFKIESKTKIEKLSFGIILTGGGSELKNIVEILKKFKYTCFIQRFKKSKS